MSTLAKGVVLAGGRVQVHAPTNYAQNDESLADQTNFETSQQVTLSSMAHSIQAHLGELPQSSTIQ